MVKERLGPNSAFYKELDKSREKRSRCGCVTLVVAFVLLLLATETALFLSVKAIKSKPSTGNISGALSTLREGQNVSKLDLEGGAFEAVISQGLLCQKLQDASGFKGVSCQITEENLELSGKMGILPSNTKVMLVPRVEKEKLVFDVTGVYIGKLKIPNLSGRIGEKTLKAVYAAAPDLQNANVESVELQEGVMMITARKP